MLEKRLSTYKINKYFLYPLPETSYWRENALDNLKTQLKRDTNRKRAKNVILFLGDGMGVSTHTAARIYQGQLNKKSGEENSLYFEKFPYTGLSKVRKKHDIG